MGRTQPLSHTLLGHTEQRDRNALPRPAAILFDLDGTLVDSAPGIATSLRHGFQSAGLIMPARDLALLIGPPMRVIARRLEPSISDAQLDIIEPSYRSHYDSIGWSETILFPGVTATLHYLRQKGIALFLVTNKPRLPTHRLLAHFELSELFTETVSRDSQTPPYSSKSAMIAGLLLRHNLPPLETCMVGDTAEDQEAAYAHALTFIYADYGYGSVPDAEHAIHKTSDLLNLFPLESDTPAT